MLRYNFKLNDNINDTISIDVLSYQISNGFEDNIMVTFIPNGNNKGISVNDKISILSIKEHANDFDDTGILNDLQTLKTSVLGVNEETNEFTIEAPSKRQIDITSITEYVENGITYWEFFFENGHFFSSHEEIDIELIYDFLNGNFLSLNGLNYVNCKTLSCEKPIDNSINIEYVSQIIFDTFGSLNNKIIIKRSQTLFSSYYNPDEEYPIQVTFYKPRVALNIPIITNLQPSIMQQDLIQNAFVEDEMNKVIPNFVEMEKHIYSPYIVIGDKYTPITKINFNLHFRLHSGENWTVKDTDDWNFSHYGYTQANDPYYSFPEPYQSCQSDLLGYLNFNNNDVKYQKNVLQKSFLRLYFYDSTNPANQNLLTYSTIFFNTNKLYTKFVRGQQLDDWYISEDINVKYDKISTKFEVNKNKLNNGSSSHDIEKIEEYRLSSQFSVQNKYCTNFSSEGFYLYLWADNKTIEPQNIYMKVEFNHAGFGRTIPMMMPYHISAVSNSTKGFKNNKAIKDDWDNPDSKYTIPVYNEYLYLKLKYVYNEHLKTYIYYLDSDTYGDYAAINGDPNRRIANIVNNNNILNINLYEARINF